MLTTDQTETQSIDKQLDEVIFAPSMNIYERGLRIIELIQKYGKNEINKYLKLHNCKHTAEALMNAVENLDFLFQKPYLEKLPRDSNGRILKTFIDYAGSLLEKSHDRATLEKQIRALFDEGKIRSTTKTEDAKKEVRKAKEGKERYIVTSYRIQISNMKKNVLILQRNLRLYQEMKKDKSMDDVRNTPSEEEVDAMLESLKDQI